MPSVSPKQARFMAAAAHSKIPQKVAKEFNQADKGSKILKRGNSRGR